MLGSATDGLIEIINGSIFNTLDTSGREPSEIVAERVVDDLKNATDISSRIGYLIVGGEVRAVKACESEGQDEDSDGPYTIWMVSTHNEESE